MSSIELSQSDLLLIIIKWMCKDRYSWFIKWRQCVKTWDKTSVDQSENQITQTEISWTIEAQVWCFTPLHFQPEDAIIYYFFVSLNTCMCFFFCFFLHMWTFFSLVFCALKGKLLLHSRICERVTSWTLSLSPVSSPPLLESESSPSH